MSDDIVAAHLAAALSMRSRQRGGRRGGRERNGLPAARGVEAALSRRRVPDDLRAQKLDQPCQLIFLCLYSQYVT